MPRRSAALLAAALTAALLAGCTSAAAPTAHGRPSASPSRVPSPSPSATPKPKPTHTPAKKPPKGPATGSATAASLDIPGAGTLEIPAWPSQPGMHYRGPDGSQGSTGTSSVALTFDDGPGPYTSKILDVLDANHVKATFCLIGQQIHAYRSVVKRMIDDGMTLCDHSWDHDEHIGKHNAPYIANNLERVVDAVHKINPKATVAYYRNPGGNFTKGTVRVSELLGMRPLFWSVDTVDWTRPGVSAIEKSLTTHTHRDSIVLMHDGGGDRSETVAAVRALLPSLKHRYHLIALPTARTVHINPGSPAPPLPPTTPPASPSAPATPSTPATPATPAASKSPVTTRP
jgi:peptidoglycan-N-acetylglucosamine deacetylase